MPIDSSLPVQPAPLCPSRCQDATSSPGTVSAGCSCRRIVVRPAVHSAVRGIFRARSVQRLLELAEDLCVGSVGTRLYSKGRLVEPFDELQPEPPGPHLRLAEACPRSRTGSGARPLPWAESCAATAGATEAGPAP